MTGTESLEGGKTGYSILRNDLAQLSQDTLIHKPPIPKYPHVHT